MTCHHHLKFLVVMLAIVSFSIKPLSAEECGAHKSEKFDLTTTDITSIQNLNAKSISIFGIHPGMRMEEAEAAIAELNHLELKDDMYNPGRIYIYSGGKSLAYLIWENDNPYLNRIVLYEPIVPFLAGDARGLFTQEVLNPFSDICKNTMGKYDRSAVTLNVKSINLKHISYFYQEKQMEVIRQMYENNEEFMIVLHNN